LKYPTIFNTADWAVLTKMDLAEAVGFDEASALENIQSVRPGMPVMRISGKTGEGIQELTRLLRNARAGCTVASAG
jgi:hydrogenase nickel incorporation protein HypB